MTFQRTFLQTATIFLIGLVAIPAPLLVAPQQAHAIFGVGDTVIEVGLNLLEDTLNAIESTISAVAEVVQEVATVAMYIREYVLEPLTFILSGNMLKAITASVINFVIGGTNGSGRPQFITNLAGYNQTIATNQTTSFLLQFSKQSNSPFSAAITSSLRTNYLQGSTLAGFFASNQCTLTQFSPNINSYLKGNFSQGGWGAWFALTTQDKNNPYMLYQNTQAQMSANVQAATTHALQTLNWGQGFLSWCGSDSSSTGPSTGSSGQACDPAGPATQCPGTGFCKATTSDPSKGVCTVAAGSSTAANAPGDPCTNSDGSPGKIKTPGSVIKDSLQKALASNQDKLVQMGNISADVNSIMGNIAAIASTVNMASQLIGGDGGGGLAGFSVSDTSGGTSSNPSYLGVDAGTVLQSSGSASQAIAKTSIEDTRARATKYESLWQSILTATNAAGSTLNSLVACEKANNDDSSDAQGALLNEVSPLLTQAATASTTIANARALASSVEAEASSTASGAAGAFAADLQALQTAHPSTSDVEYLQLDIQSPATAASANPGGSLTVSGTSPIDRMNLLQNNAQAFLQACQLAAGHGGTP